MAACVEARELAERIEEGEVVDRCACWSYVSAPPPVS